MFRAICLLLACVLAAGCKSPPTPSMDPFLGKATVPPPKPGAIMAQRTGDPYYPPAATSPLRTTNISPPPPASAASRLTPPGGQWSSNPPPSATAQAPIRQQSYQQPVYPQPSVFQQPLYQQPVYQQPICPPCVRPVRSANPDDNAPGVRSAAICSPVAPVYNNCGPVSQPAGSQPAVARTTGQPTLAKPRLAGDSDPAEPRRLEVDDHVTNIMDLPPATRPGTTSAQRDSGVRTASYETPVSDSSPDRSTPQPTAKPPAVRNRYGYDSSYQWLKGQLEYSRAARRWKLRYIPLDGETDDHGGSVILADTPALEKFKAGDYVLVEGQVSGPDDQTAKTFSPLYRVSKIDPIK